MALVVAVLVCTLMLGVVVGLALCQKEIGRAYRAVRERIAPESATGPAIEETARHLRRLRHEVMAPSPGTTMARRRGAAAAYDDLLLDAACALGVPDSLSELPEGTDREAERLRRGAPAARGRARPGLTPAPGPGSRE